MALPIQCADIFFLKADICQLGMDQRKVRATTLRRAVPFAAVLC